ELPIEGSLNLMSDATEGVSLELDDACPVLRFEHTTERIVRILFGLPALERPGDELADLVSPQHLLRTVRPADTNAPVGRVVRVLVREPRERRFRDDIARNVVLELGALAGGVFDPEPMPTLRSTELVRYERVHRSGNGPGSAKSTAGSVNMVPVTTSI